MFSILVATGSTHKKNFKAQFLRNLKTIKEDNDINTYNQVW